MSALPLTALLLALTWLHGPVGAGVLWDAFNGLGFVALALLGALHLEAPVGATSTTGDLRAALVRHTRLAYAALALVAVHATGLLGHDRVLLEYVAPDAPGYMLAGLVALPVLGAIVWSARQPRRRRLFRDRASFRVAHRALAALLLALSVWHVVGSAFYLDHWLQGAACALFATAWVTAPRQTRALVGRVTPDVRPLAAAAAVLSLLTAHTVMRNL